MLQIAPRYLNLIGKYLGTQKKKKIRKYLGTQKKKKIRKYSVSDYCRSIIQNKEHQ